MKVRLAGRHRWPDAPATVAYLRHPHRHVFHVAAHVGVADGDRRVEFFTAQAALEAFVRARWPEATPLVDFGALSCEDIAAVVVSEWDARPFRVEVSEDGENVGVAEA